MTLPHPRPQQLQAVIIGGQPYHLVAFYYPDHDTPCDVTYQAQFLANFYSCQVTVTINGITGTFLNSEAAFQATKWWTTTKRKQLE